MVVHAEPPARSSAELATSLIRTGFFDTYFVYEHGDVWTVVWGVRAEIVVNSACVRVRHDSVERSWPAAGGPVRAARAALERLALNDWVVCGWVTLEAAHLVVPEVEVRIDSGRASVVRGGEPRLGALLEHLRTAPDGVPVGQEEAPADFVDAYLAGRAATAPERSFLLSIGGLTATGLCPQVVLEAGSDGTVAARPGSFDEVIEVCEPDSVVADEPAARLRGRLTEGKTPWDALELLVPGGATSGAVLLAADDGFLDAGLVVRAGTGSAAGPV